MDKIVVISGGTRGIGLATAHKYLRDGDKVVVLGRRRNEETLQPLQALGEVTFIPGDVSKASDCAQVVEQVIRQYGRIDILVNVAGVTGERKAFTEIDLQDVSNTVGINLMGTIYPSHYAAQEMVKAKSGVIVNVGSICGHMANTESIGYHASKGGVTMVTLPEASAINGSTVMADDGYASFKGVDGFQA